MKIDSEKRQRAHDASHLTWVAVERTKARKLRFTCSDRLIVNLVNSFDPVRSA